VLTIEQARALYPSTDPVHDFNHVLRVLAMAERLAQMEGADLTIVRAAVLLHDISRVSDDNHNTGYAMNVPAHADHAISASEQAREILADQPPEVVEAVIHAIQAHRFRNDIEPQTLEAQIVFDADKLDAIGAIGIARAFAFAGEHSNPLWASVRSDYHPDGDEPHTPVHEFEVKLKHIRDRLYTASARQLADARHAFMVAFFDQLHAEVGGSR
jgi:uncharacterized protein